MKSNKLISLLLAFFIGSFTAFAQSEAEDKKKVEQIVKDFAKEYENITDAESTDKLMSFIAPNLRSTNVLSSVTGAIDIQYANREDFEKHLNTLRGDKGLKMKYKVKDIFNINLRGNVASVVYAVDYSNKKDEYLLSKGQENVTMTLLKKGDTWKIIHFNFVNIEDQKEQGPCLCELYVSPNGNYAARTIVPGGKSYNTVMNNFEFRKDGKDKMIRIEGEVYRFAANGDITMEIASSTREKAPTGVIGNAKDTDEAVLMIIQEVMYKERCTDFKVRKKR